MGNKRETKLIILIVLLLATCLGVYNTAKTESVGNHLALKSFLGKIDGYTIENDVTLEKKVDQFLDLDDYTFTDYTSGDGNTANLFIGYYYSVAKVSAAHSPLSCFPGQGWTIDQPVLGQLVVGEQTINYAEMVATIQEKKELVIYWYQAGNSTTSFVFKNKFRAMLNKFTKGNEQHAFVRVTVPFANTSYDMAKKAGAEFIKAFYPKFTEFIDKNGAQASMPINANR